MTQELADALIAGPRGRGLLVEFALFSAQREAQPYALGDLSSAIHYVSARLDPAWGTSAMADLYIDTASSTLISEEDAHALAASIPESQFDREYAIADVAGLLRRTRLAPIVFDLLQNAFVRTVDAARYWQEPTGLDVLSAEPIVRESLAHVAHHLAASPLTSSWLDAWKRPQFAVSYHDKGEFVEPCDKGRAALSEWRKQTLELEATAFRDWRSAAISYTGEWWSHPGWVVPSSTRAQVDGAAMGLWCVEDSLGWESAVQQHLGVPGGLQVYEIDSAQAWAQLCRDFPMDVSDSKGPDWFRTTGRDGAWVIPDWFSVAEKFDGVHLSVASYLALAGTAIKVDEDRASVIAGWAPDETFWFSPDVRYVDEPQLWKRVVGCDNDEGFEDELIEWRRIR